jgi:hypothetical protein
MSDGHEQAGGAATQERPTDEEIRAAYEAELNRITSSEMILQTAVSLINIGGNRLGLVPSGGSSGGDQSQAGLSPEGSSPAGTPPAGAQRDLEQVRDAIDGASALLPVLERRMPRELGPLRDAIAQLQVAYAREASATANQSASAGAAQSARAPLGKDPSGAPSGGQDPSAKGGDTQGPQEDTPRPGPAESSGRLWVPGR